ncbi:stress-activated protein kinase JNK-like [Sycon ciliatum]|uniref:stress-activated protein kinase JNK-like n=1 Tax=Sycon ciliatum TaxID=27933 RepID=UPI0031F693C9
MSGGGSEAYSFYRTTIGEETFDLPQRYEKASLIAKGGQAVVVEAWDKREKQKVAIKKICKPFQDASSAKNTFREIVLMRNLQHPQCMGALDIFTSASNLQEFSDVYLVMQKMDCGLSSKLGKHLDHSDIILILRGILNGVRYLHARNIIHGDLKPSNILMNSDCTLKISDFGKSLVDDGEGNTGVTSGTTIYLAPEVIQGGHCGKGVDSWAIGCILSRLLGRQRLHQAKDSTNQHMITSLGSDVMETPEDWIRTNQAKDLISKMLKINPDERISIVHALRHPYVRRPRSSREPHRSAPDQFTHTMFSKDRTVEEWKQITYGEIQNAQDPARPHFLSGEVADGALAAAVFLVLVLVVVLVVLLLRVASQMDVVNLYS